MNTRILKCSLLSGFCAHIAALVVALVTAIVANKNPDPDTVVSVSGYICLAVGTVVCAVLSKLCNIGVLGSLTSAAVYLLPMFIASVASGGDTKAYVKVVVYLTCAVIVVLVTVFAPKTSVSRKKNPHKNAMRYTDRL